MTSWNAFFLNATDSCSRGLRLSKSTSPCQGDFNHCIFRAKYWVVLMVYCEGYSRWLQREATTIFFTHELECNNYVLSDRESSDLVPDDTTLSVVVWAREALILQVTQQELQKTIGKSIYIGSDQKIPALSNKSIFNPNVLCTANKQLGPAQTIQKVGVAKWSSTPTFQGLIWTWENKCWMNFATPAFNC